jgi:ActR/RegA family two-component response regulator
MGKPGAVIAFRAVTHQALHPPTKLKYNEVKIIEARADSLGPAQQGITTKGGGNPMARPKVLLVDDDTDEIFLTQRSLEAKNFEVVSVTSVTEAFKQIATQSFDVLITDLHMPEPGDGFAVVTAMRHSQPETLTLVVSGFPDVQRSMSAILLQADEVLVKPFDVEQLAELLHQKVLDTKASPKKAKESVASILERDATLTVQRWLSRVEQVGELNSLPLTADERTDHLPDIIKNIATRLRKLRVIEAVATPLSRGCGAWTTPQSPKLHCAPYGPGIKNPAGVHFRNHPT